MRYSKLLLLFIFGLALISCVEAQINKTEKNKKTEEKKVKKETTPCEPAPLKPGADNLKIIAEGVYGKVEEVFLFVARSAESYKKLQGLVEDLPPASEINFDKTAVVAAFAGEKRTGGYSVAMEKSGEAVSIKVVEPAPDAITTDALTYPYQVALVPVEEEMPLNLRLSENWTRAAQNFRVTRGEIAYSGGITGRGKSYPVEGTVGVLTRGDLATLIFNFSGKGAESGKKLNEIVSGSFSSGKIEVNRLDVGDFSENPKPPVRVSGMFTGDKLNLTFAPLPTEVRDGFMAEGKIEAVKVK